MLRQTFLVLSSVAFIGVSGCTHAKPQTNLSPSAISDIEMVSVSGIPFIQAKIGNSEPLNFIVDTGFDVNVLDFGVAEQLSLSVGEMKTEKQPGGEVTTADIVPVKMRIGDTSVEDVPFTGMDIAGLGAFVGRPLAGIIGHDLLERFVIEFDYPAERFRLIESSDWTYQGTGAVLPVDIIEGEVFVESTIGLPSGRFVTAPFKMDTGSFDVAGLNLNFVRDENIIEPGVPEVPMGGIAAGGETTGRIFRASSFQIGNVVIEQPQLGYTTDSGGFENRNDAGTVGTGAFSQGKLILDYAHNQIVLENNYRGRAADEMLSGLLLISMPPNFDTVMVAQVNVGSAGEDAGFQQGDVIVSIDGESFPLLDAREAIRTLTPRKIVYRRGDEEKTVTLRPKPLLPSVESAK